jgi:hypothetical protein
MLPNNKKAKLLLPIVGILLFVVLYFVASFNYPGGNAEDKHSKGFSWLHNYWCNLLNDEALNGEPNTAQPIAFVGMVILCISLGTFWFYFPGQMPVGKKGDFIVSYSGVLSMIIAFFLLTPYDHDFLTNLSSVFGVIAFLGTLRGLNNCSEKALFAWGIMNLILVGVNAVVYYSAGLLSYLPLIQKISFVLILGWVCAVNMRCLYHLRRSPAMIR